MNLNINNSQTSDYSQIEDSKTIAAQSIDSAKDQKETEWINTKASQYWGYFNAVGDLKSAFLMKAIWNVGKGWEADQYTTNHLSLFDGWGKDTFDDILFNMEVCRRVFGDSFAEIITNNGKTRSEGGIVINIKPLDPADIKIICNKMGRIIRYEMLSRPSVKWKPEEIFHLSNNRMANQIHGISDIDTVEDVIKADYQSFENLNDVAKFQAKPFILWKFKTDDESKISAVMEKIKTVRRITGDLAVPDDENVLSWEVVQVNPSSILMEWRTDLRNKFYRMVGMPLILFGSAGSTESGGKIEYLGHEQVFEHDQRYLEKQILSQLGFEINLIPPTSLLENLQTDQNKDANQGMEIQKQDVTAGVGP